MTNDEAKGVGASKGICAGTGTSGLQATANGAFEPGSRERPMAVHRARCQFECLGDLRDGHAHEIPQLDYFRGEGVLSCQAIQRLMDGQPLLRRRGQFDLRLVKFLQAMSAAAFASGLAPGAVNEDAP